MNNKSGIGGREERKEGEGPCRQEKPGNEELCRDVQAMYVEPGTIVKISYLFRVFQDYNILLFRYIYWYRDSRVINYDDKGGGGGGGVAGGGGVEVRMSKSTSETPDGQVRTRNNESIKRPT